MRHEYRYGLHVAFDSLPALEPLILKTQDRGVFQRFVNASRRRQFCLKADWAITIGDAAPALGIEGTVVVPVAYRGEPTILDGASVPLPWVVSYLTFGLLRPLGILLTASIVHDFAYRHGALLLRMPDGSLEPRAVERHLADELFRDIVASVNQSPVASRIAWHAVRLGWPFIPYAGKRGGGKAPVRSALTALVALASLVPLVRSIGVGGVLAGIGAGYALLSIAQRFNPQRTPRIDPE